MRTGKNEADMDSQNSKFAVLETNIGHILEILELMNKRFDKAENRFERLETKVSERFQKVNDKLDKLRDEVTRDIRTLDVRLWYSFFWIVASFVGILSIMAKSFLWF